MTEQIRAELVGSVFDVVASVGDTVDEGDSLVIIESMKMEIPVIAESPGVVASVDVAVGDVLQPGDLIATVS
ncbi:MAG: biotin/lipoyl-binding carrier protein [Tomitella sp.]|nr:biotin/lipoyl-binding carrier protein [Tomitella sp.]